MVAVSLFRVAVPLDMANLKSVTSRSPLPLLALKTASENVTVTVLLSAAVMTLEIVGANLSFNAFVLLVWVVAATFPAPS